MKKGKIKWKMSPAPRSCDWCGKSPVDMGDGWVIIFSYPHESGKEVIVCSDSDECHYGVTMLSMELTIKEWNMFCDVKR